MKQILLIILAASIFINCKSPEKLMKKGRFEEAFDMAYKDLSKKPKKLAKLEPILLSSYQKIYDQDVQLVQRSLSMGETDYFNYDDKINKITTRANRVNKLLKVEKNLEEISMLKEEVYTKAYNYYNDIYQMAWSQVINGDKYPAPRAMNNLNKMRYFKPISINYDSLESELYRLGTIHTLVRLYNDSHYDHDFDNISLTNVNAPFMKYTFNPDQPYDRKMEVVIESIHPGEEVYNSSSSCYTNRVIDRYETIEVEVLVPQPAKLETETVKCGDSTITRSVWVSQPPLKKIEKRCEPVYVDVSATVHTETLHKRGRLQLGFHVYEIKDDKEVYQSQKVNESNHSSESSSYTGDGRALSFTPFPSILSVPSDRDVVQKLYAGMDKMIHKEILAINSRVKE